MTLDGNPVIWTLFHGDQPWKRECRVIGGGKGKIELSFSGALRPISVVGDPFENRNVIVSVRHAKILDYCHLLALDCLILPGGINAKVQRLDLDTGDGSLRERVRIGVRVPQSNVAKVDSGDFESSAFLFLRTERAPSLLEQAMYFRVLAIPKGNVRLFVLTLRDRSLEPYYRMIRSIPNGLVFEKTASSY